jgi:hypothetical protein
MMLRQLLQHLSEIVNFLFRGSDAKSSAIFLKHVNAGSTVRRVQHQVHRALGSQHRAERAQTRSGIDEMMEHPSTNDVVEDLAQVVGVFERQLPRFEIRQVVLPLQRLSVLETCWADINANHAGSGMTERVLCGLPCPTSRHENIEIRTVFLVRP